MGRELHWHGPAGYLSLGLLENMRNDGVLTLDRLGLGIVVDPQSRLPGKDGEAWQGLFAAGALTASQFCEITAVPDTDAEKKVAQAITDRVTPTR